LRQALSQYFRRYRLFRQLRIPPEAGRLRARIYDRLEVIHESGTEDGHWLIDVELDQADLSWLEHQEDFHAQWLLPDPEILARSGASL